MIALSPAPLVDNLLEPVMLLESLDEVNRRLAITSRAKTKATFRGRARLLIDRAWIEMCLRDRHERGAPMWRRWDGLMQADVAAATQLAHQLKGQGR